MKKIIFSILFGLLFINPMALCEEQKALQNKTDAQTSAVNKQADEAIEQKNSQTGLTESEVLNLDDNSFTITDEQFQEAKNTAEIEDDNNTLDRKIINSSHFTVGTPSKTYNPLNKSVGGK